MLINDSIGYIEIKQAKSSIFKHQQNDFWLTFQASCFVLALPRLLCHH